MILGIDISTHALHLCFLHDNAVAWSKATLRASGGGWFAAVQGTTAGLAGALHEANDLRPREAYIERGWGENRNADFLLGAMLGATAVALTKVLPGIHVEHMTTHEWKRAVTAEVGITTKGGKAGNANARKEQANSACRVILMERMYVDAERVNRLTPDELDAFGVAWTAAHR